MQSSQNSQFLGAFSLFRYSEFAFVLKGSAQCWVVKYIEDIHNKQDVYARVMNVNFEKQRIYGAYKYAEGIGHIPQYNIHDNLILPFLHIIIFKYIAYQYNYVYLLRFR